MFFDQLANSPRLLIEADLKPIQGHRFQPTGFPDLGAATYQAPDGTQMLLVESAQSVANRLETTAWDEGANDLVEPLKGLPYVKSVIKDGVETNSILEAHRLNSPYIVKSDGFKTIKDEIGFNGQHPFDRRRLIAVLAKYDFNSLLHGIFLEKVGGTVRLPRVVSGFIEARNVGVAAYGGVKVDRVQPGTKGDEKTTPYGKAKEGFGNVPYHREDYTGEVTAYFNLDLAQIRGYGLGQAGEELLIGLALYKIQRFLREGLRLRTACDFDVQTLRVTRPEGYNLPEIAQLEEAMPKLIEAASDLFADEPVTVVHFKK
ncbi:type I-U CRISPR-associated protein Cas7 [Lujinxingia vulgaris]|uniref:Type I-U CRISPR-associated protein Cas7 n=1 Tax=Lujinxingia vulgaris TaxID=2600176 RepID=A0A5C6X131_9DELT|nr:type I-U CRISPR-associated RAMP protein Csb1/Cas7u [Lujinxingia vulgaris]TXD34808.1 type I-U CRISPR-associated protein Cas7 [Lujinxingia vulgaris]